MRTNDLQSVYGYPDRKVTTLFWTPTLDMVGRHTVCYGGVDSERYVRGGVCVIWFPRMGADHVNNISGDGESL